uniref:Smp_202920 n=1 Tax=Schistosoma mansoni TaxID=6183 RepID=A0A3Q0KV28_SCHMA
MHYSTKQFGLFTFSIIIILHLYLFKDEIQLYFIQLYNQTIKTFHLQNDSMTIIIIIIITIISSILLIGLSIHWILYNKLLLIKSIIIKILIKLKLLNNQNKHQKIE